MNGLLGIKQSSDIAHVDIPSAEDVKHFKQDSDGPQLKPMQAHWDDLDSPWNDRLCELFLHHCTSCYKDMEFDSDTDTTIEDMFRRRL
jgi:hypothetical protein